MSGEPDEIEILCRQIVLDLLERIAEEIEAQDNENPIAINLLIDRAEQLVEHIRTEP